MKYSMASNISKPQISKPLHFNWIDSLRFFAAFCVLAGHYRGACFETYSLLSADQQNISTILFFSITRLPHVAVLIFFVLSGFLVGGKAIERLENHSFKFNDYALDRFVRIMLPLVSALLLIIPVSYYINGTVLWDLWFTSLFSLQGVIHPAISPPLWSLSYEVWFYIIMGAVGLIFSAQNSGLKIKIGVMLLICSIFVFSQLQLYYLILWIMGAFAYKIRPTKPSIFYMILSICLMIISTIAIQCFDSKIPFASFLLNISNTLIFWEFIFGISSCIFIQQIILRQPKTTISKFLNRTGTKLAAFSYTLYLTHMIVLEVLLKLGIPRSPSINLYSISLYILWMGIALVVAYILYLLFEKHTSSCKKLIRTIFPNIFHSVKA